MYSLIPSVYAASGGESDPKRLMRRSYIWTAPTTRDTSPTWPSGKRNWSPNCAWRNCWASNRD